MKLLVFIFILLCGTTATTAQTSIKEIIGNIPEEIIPYVNSDQKNELLEFTRKKDSVKIKNIFNGTTSIDTICSNFAKISTNRAAELQLILLPANDSTQIICMVKTLKSPVKESTIKFYHTNWQPIDSTFGLPDNSSADSLLNMFVHKPDTMTEERFNILRNYIEPVMMYADLKNTDNTITLNLSLPLIQKDSYNELKAIIKKISFKWDGQKFKKC